MARRHRRPARLSPRARRTLLGLAMVAVLAPVAGVALGSAIEDVSQCRETVELDVLAAPEIAPVLAAHAQSWSKDARPRQGTCVNVRVVAADSASVAAAFAAEAGVELDLGDAEVTQVEPPDVWVPEALTWLVRLEGDLDGTLSERADPVAESPVGLGVSQAQTTIAEGMMWRDTTVSLADPRTDPASLAVLLAGGADENARPARDPSGAIPMSAAGVTAYNTTHPDSPLTFIEPQPYLSTFEYPYVTRRELPAATDRAVDAFRSSLSGTAFTDTLIDFGLRQAGPYPQRPGADAVAAAIDDWSAG